MPDEIWELSDEAREYCRLQGYTPEEVEDMEKVRKERFDAIRERRMAGLSEEDFKNYYRDKYDLEHECHCAEDEFLGDVVMLMKCQAETYVLMRAKLSEVMEDRDILRDQLDQLRVQVASLGGTPNV